jgi:hypothetical protein
MSGFNSSGFKTMMQNIYILMVSWDTNDPTYIVDSARADGYKRGAEPHLAPSQLEDIREASALWTRCGGLSMIAQVF